MKSDTGTDRLPPEVRVDVVLLLLAIGDAPLAHLDALPVREAALHTGYSRSKFGPAWYDLDRNHCDTRNDILRRDLIDERLDGNCIVLDGLLRDPYTGLVIEFVRGPRSTAVQIDHIISLSNAWETGAQRISYMRRLALANDPLNLIAVDGPTNQAKGDRDASEWLPPLESEHCDYVVRQVAVKTEYKLWVTPPEAAAMREVLEACRDGEGSHLASAAGTGGSISTVRSWITP